MTPDVLCTSLHENGVWLTPLFIMGSALCTKLQMLLMFMGIMWRCKKVNLDATLVHRGLNERMRILQGQPISSGHMLFYVLWLYKAILLCFSERIETRVKWNLVRESVWIIQLWSHNVSAMWCTDAS